MTLASPKLTEAAWRLLPGPLRRKLRTGAASASSASLPAGRWRPSSASHADVPDPPVAHVSAGVVGGRPRWFAGAGRELRGQPVGLGAQGQAACAQGDPAVLDGLGRAWVVLALASKFAQRMGAQSRACHRSSEVLVVERGLLPGGQLRDLRDPIPDLPLRALCRPRVRRLRGARECPRGGRARNGYAVGQPVARALRWHASGAVRSAYPPLTLAPPGAEHHLGEAQRVEGVVALLALADGAAVDRRGPLDGPGTRA